MKIHFLRFFSRFQIVFRSIRHEVADNRELRVFNLNISVFLRFGYVLFMVLKATLTNFVLSPSIQNHPESIRQTLCYSIKQGSGSRRIRPSSPEYSSGHQWRSYERFSGVHERHFGLYFRQKWLFFTESHKIHIVNINAVLAVVK